MDNFRNFIIQVTKIKFEEKNKYFPFTFGISNWELKLPTQKQERLIILLHIVIIKRQKM